MAGEIVLRGQFVIVTVARTYGKPRPALVVQANLFSELPSIVVCPLTTDLRDDVPLVRLTVEPSLSTGLREISQLMIDKISVAPRDKVGAIIGAADEALMLRVTRALAVLLAID